LLQKEADKVECIMTPDNETFTSVDQYYIDFSQITDIDVAELGEELIVPIIA
jgi:predicted phosphoribosyltransferase